MNIYNIVKGQLITIWIFGLIATFICFIFLMNSDDLSGWAIIFILIPCLLIFYTIGWKAYRKQHINKNSFKIIDPQKATENINK